MRLSAFQDLCRKEWDDRKGDVRTLWLVEGSYRELSDDAQRYRQTEQLDIYSSKDDARDMVNPQAQVRVLANPCTRTIVQMRIARDLDVADVWYGDGHFETRLLDQAKAAELGLISW